MPSTCVERVGWRQVFPHSDRDPGRITTDRRCVVCVGGGGMGGLGKYVVGLNYFEIAHRSVWRCVLEAERQNGSAAF